ncbi:bZIP transcription factor 27 [Hirschfeldia incana]|nr:bZIP transcription factor 27 [Hirschfeldia incana]
MTQVTMEEVWKEINLASLHQRRQLNVDHEPMLSNQDPNNSIFKDFLNKPLNQEPPPPPPSSSSTLHRSLLPPPETALSLNPHSINTHFDESARSGCFGKKRGDQDSEESRGDRRHKRMIKNRESAARSRARKQECIYKRAGACNISLAEGKCKTQETGRAVEIGGSNSTPNKEKASTVLDSSLLRKNIQLMSWRREARKLCTFLA